MIYGANWLNGFHMITRLLLNKFNNETHFGWFGTKTNFSWNLVFLLRDKNIVKESNRVFQSGCSHAMLLSRQKLARNSAMGDFQSILFKLYYFYNKRNTVKIHICLAETLFTKNTERTKRTNLGEFSLLRFISLITSGAIVWLIETFCLPDSITNVKLWERKYLTYSHLFSCPNYIKGENQKMF